MIDDAHHLEGVDAPPRVQAGGRRADDVRVADGARPEPRARPVAGGLVARRADDHDVGTAEALGVQHERGVGERGPRPGVGELVVPVASAAHRRILLG